MVVELSRGENTADRYRKSLQILLAQNIQDKIPQHQTFQKKTQNRIEDIYKNLQQSVRMPQYQSPGVTGGGNQSGSYSSGNGNFDSFVNAIAGKESGGNYGAVNRHSGAMGKYQIMPGNISSWSREILGYSISPQQFLRSPQLQEQIARGKLQQYYNKWGPGGAAVAWYSGPGNVEKKMGSTRSQGSYPSINDYMNDILRRLR